MECSGCRYNQGRPGRRVGLRRSATRAPTQGPSRKERQAVRHGELPAASFSIWHQAINFRGRRPRLLRQEAVGPTARGYAVSVSKSSTRRPGESRHSRDISRARPITCGPGRQCPYCAGVRFLGQTDVDTTRTVDFLAGSAANSRQSGPASSASCGCRPC